VEFTERKGLAGAVQRLRLSLFAPTARGLAYTGDGSGARMAERATVREVVTKVEGLSEH